MVRRTPFTVFLWLLAVALLPVRVANAHLHMCLDGQDSPVALHVEDEAGDHDEERGAGHEDRDIRVSGPALLAKSGQIDKAAVVQAVVALNVILLPAPIRVIATPDLPAPELSSIFDLRPPPRAPPC